MLISIDQALQKSGFAVFDESKCIESGSWEVPPKKNSLPERINYIILHIEDLCYVYDVDRIVFEDTQRQQNALTFKHLVYLEAILEFWCFKNGYEYVIMPPAHWRKVIGDNYGIKFGRKRDEQKKAALDFAKSQTQNEYMTSDSSDAFCMGLAAIVNHEFESKYKKSVF